MCRFSADLVIIEEVMTQAFGPRAWQAWGWVEMSMTG